jgi:hypothetical protein
MSLQLGVQQGLIARTKKSEKKVVARTKKSAKRAIA